MGPVVVSVLHLFCYARLVFFHGWSDAARELTRTCAHDESSEFRSLTMCVSAFPRVRARVAPQGGLGGSFRAPSACRVVIGELMSGERAQWHFVHHFSWRWRGRRMDMPMCVPDFCGPFEKSVTSTDMLRTSGNPAPSVCANILVAFARRIMFQAHRAAETCERGPKGPGRSCSKMCERQKQTCGMSAHKSRSFVNMFAGQWSLPLSSRCIDSIRPSVLVKLSCRLCRLVFFLQCAMPQKLRSRARLASGSMDWMQPFCCANMFQLVSYRLPCTCSTDTFFTKHYSRTCGAVPNMLDLRRRSSFPILLRCGMMQLATAPKLFREVCCSKSP